MLFTLLVKWQAHSRVCGTFSKAWTGLLLPRRGATRAARTRSNFVVLGLVVLTTLTKPCFDEVSLLAGSAGTDYSGIPPYSREDTDALHVIAYFTILRSQPPEARSPDLPASLQLQVRQWKFQIASFRPSLPLPTLTHATSTSHLQTSNSILASTFTDFPSPHSNPPRDPAPPPGRGSTTGPEPTLTTPLHTGICGLV